MKKFELNLAQPIESNTITFFKDEEWLIKIFPEGKILFNDNFKPSAGEFASEFIRIVEENISFKGER